MGIVPLVRAVSCGVLAIPTAAARALGTGLTHCGRMEAGRRLVPCSPADSLRSALRGVHASAFSARGVGAELVHGGGGPPSDAATWPVAPGVPALIDCSSCSARPWLSWCELRSHSTSVVFLLQARD